MIASMGMGFMRLASGASPTNPNPTISTYA